MADREPSAVDQTRLGAAILVAGLVQTLGRDDPDFQEAFLAKLGEYHRELDGRHLYEAKRVLEDAQWILERGLFATRE